MTTTSFHDIVLASFASSSAAATAARATSALSGCTPCVPTRPPRRPREGTRRLLEGFGPDTAHVQQLRPTSKRAVGVASRDDVGGDARVESRHAREERRARGVEIHPRRRHRGSNRLVEFARQLFPRDVVLVKTHAEGVRVDLHELRHGILEPTRDAHRAASRDVEIGSSVAASGDAE